MTQKTNRNPVISRRLLPLYIASFCQGFVLWYAVEKLFMHSIGFDDAGIGIMIASYSALMLLLETPSGILADRWSRKGVLMVASVALAASALIGGLSTEPVLYIVSALLWGTFYSFYSGTYDSVVYDTVYEETGNSDGYERYSGRINIAESAALVGGSVIGGFVGQMWGLPAAYFWSIPIAFAAIVALWFFKEPQLHKAAAHEPLKKQVIETFKSVTTKGVVLRLMFVMLLVTLIMEVLYEFNQLWFIQTNTPTALFGVANAVVLSASGIGGLVLGWVGEKRRAAMVVALACVVISSLVLAIPSPLGIILVAQFILGTSGTMLTVMIMHDIHDQLPSRIRAGAASAISTLSRVALIPIALGFGAISAHVSIFAAAWILAILAILAGVGEIRNWLSVRKQA